MKATMQIRTLARRLGRDLSEFNRPASKEECKARLQHCLGILEEIADRDAVVHPDVHAEASRLQHVHRACDVVFNGPRGCGRDINYATVTA